MRILKRRRGYSDNCEMDDDDDSPSLLSGLKTPLDLSELCEDELSCGIEVVSKFQELSLSGIRPETEGTEGRLILGFGGFAEIRMLRGRRWSWVRTR